MAEDTSSEIFTDSTSSSFDHERYEPKPLSLSEGRDEEEQQYNREDLEGTLLRQLSIGDALRLVESRTEEGGAANDIVGAESALARVFTDKSTGAVELPPDGGYGWVCCFCVTFIQVSTWGANAGYGVFLQYYIDNDVFPGATSLKFAWNAGLIVFNAQFWAPFSLVAVRMLGLKTTMAIACCTHCAGYILASFATELWQLFCCQGIIMGMSYSFLFVPANTIVPQWFLKKRGLASGICMAGTGMGGVIYSLAVSAMIQKENNQKWALRMVGIVTFVTISVSIFFIKSKNQPPRQKITFHNLSNNVKLMFDKEVLQEKRLWYIVVWFATAILGYNMILFSFSTYATSRGLSTHDATTLTALINAAQTVGRPTLGFIADRFAGHINFTLFLEIILAILTFAFWINAKTLLQLIFCALMLGGTLGVGNVMNSVIISDSFAPEQFSAAWSFLNMTLGFALLFVEVIALSLRDFTLSNPFIYTQIFAGCIFIVAFISLLPLREWTVKKVLKQRRRAVQQELKLLTGKRQSGVINSEEEEFLKQQNDRYNYLLQGGMKSWLRRTFHPIKL